MKYRILRQKELFRTIIVDRDWVFWFLNLTEIGEEVRILLDFEFAEKLTLLNKIYRIFFNIDRPT